MGHAAGHPSRRKVRLNRFTCSARGNRQAAADARSVREEVSHMAAMLTLLAVSGALATILWIIAVILVIGGIVQIVQGQVVFGIVLIVVGLLVGPGGVSIF